MIHAYFNYPNPHVTIHQNPDCGYIRPHDRPQQRIFHLNIETVSSMLKMFENNEVRFTAQATLNDMWLEVDFNNQAFEVAIVLYIKEILGRYYKPYQAAPISTHCE